MGRSLLGLLILAVSLTTVVWGDEARDEAIKKDRRLIEGKWRVIGLEVNGNKAMEVDAKKLSVVNGSNGTWTLWSEGKQVAKGTSTIDPAKTPRTLDFQASEGEDKDKVYLGIYELHEKTRKLCFAPPGKERPTKFATTPGSEHILVMFEREKPE